MFTQQPHLAYGKGGGVSYLGGWCRIPEEEAASYSLTKHHHHGST